MWSRERTSLWNERAFIPEVFSDVTVITCAALSVSEWVSGWTGRRRPWLRGCSPCWPPTRSPPGPRSPGNTRHSTFSCQRGVFFLWLDYSNCLLSSARRAATSAVAAYWGYLDGSTCQASAIWRTFWRRQGRTRPRSRQPSPRIRPSDFIETLPLPTWTPLS